MRLRARAPAKLNLCLFLGPVRGDGRHELVTVFESLSLADSLGLSSAPGSSDEVVCPGIEGPNLADTALAGLRSAGWSPPPVRVEIAKRIPVAAGLGGGSADAAAVLRLADAAEPLGPGVAARLARELGADVPSQLEPGLWLGTGAGEVLEPLAGVEPHALVIVRQDFGLSTAEVYREADRLELARSADELERRRQQILDGVSSDLLVNDLEPATLSLAPAVGDALEALRDAGADAVLVCGSGPTAAGILWGEAARERAEAVARELSARGLEATVAVPVASDFAEVEAG